MAWKPWTGKPQPPIDPATGEPCNCWGSDKNKQRVLGKDSYIKCPYCDGYYQKDKGNEEHERLYHSQQIAS